MTTRYFSFSKRTLFLIAACAAAIPAIALADWVELVNGDRYSGKVVSLDETRLLLDSEVQGRIELARGKVAVIHLGEAAPAKTPAQSELANAAMPPNAKAVDPIQKLRTTGVDPSLMRQIEQQFFTGMSPEVTETFRKTMQGLAAGSVSLKDIQSQARDSVEQIKSLQGDLGEEAGDLLNGYLYILENFLEKTEVQPPPPAE